MLFHIIKKELLDNINSPKFYITYLICFILIVISFITGINDYKSDIEEYNAGIALNQDKLDNASLANFPYSTEIYKKPDALSALVRGIEGNLGRKTSVSRVGSVSPKFSSPKYEKNPMFSVFGPLDLDFIVRIVLSLFVILFIYDTISGEKERGTLKLIMSNKVPRDVLLFGKSMGSFISISIPFIIPFLFGSIIFSLFPGISIDFDTWCRIFLLMIVYLLYLLLFFTLGLFVSSKTKSSSTSFLVLLFIWVVFIVIIPKASIMLSRQIYKIPSVHEINYQKREKSEEAQKRFFDKMRNFSKENPKKENETSEEYMKRYREYINEQSSINLKEIEESNARIDSDYESKKELQRTIALNISKISPSSILKYITMKLSRTDIESHYRLKNAVSNYQNSFADFSNALEKEYNEKRYEYYRTKEDEKVDISGMPVFKYKKESLKESFMEILFDLLILVLFSILFFTLAYFSFRKYDVR